MNVSISGLAMASQHGWSERWKVGSKISAASRKLTLRFYVHQWDMSPHDIHAQTLLLFYFYPRLLGHKLNRAHFEENWLHVMLGLSCSEFSIPLFGIPTLWACLVCREVANVRSLAPCVKASKCFNSGGSTNFRIAIVYLLTTGGTTHVTFSMISCVKS